MFIKGFSGPYDVWLKSNEHFQITHAVCYLSSWFVCVGNTASNALVNLNRNLEYMFEIVLTNM